MIQIGGGREFGRKPCHVGAEGIEIATEVSTNLGRQTGIEKAIDNPCLRRQRQTVLHDGAGAILTHTRRQQIGPVFGAEQVAHVLVVRVHQHTIARPDEIGCTGQEATASATVALNGGNGQVAVGTNDRFGQIVDGVDVGPRLVSRTFCCFDQVEMDAIRPEVAATHQYDHLRWPLRRPAIGFKQALALLRTHGTVGELEVEVADRIVAAILTDARLLVADVLPGLVPGRPPACQRLLGHDGTLFGKSQRRRQLDAFPTLDVPDPHGAIGCRPTQGGLSTCDDVSGPTSQQALFKTVEQMARLAKQGVGHAGKAIRGIELGQHNSTGIPRPVDDSVALFH